MRRGHVVAAVWVLLVVGAGGQTVEPELSATEKRVVASQIATLKNPGERKMAREWSNSKKVAEVICRPAALVELKKQGADKVFLGSEAADSLVLVSPAKLTGLGQYLTAEGWKYISFTCDVDPATGKTLKFTSVAAAVPGQSMV